MLLRPDGSMMPPSSYASHHISKIQVSFPPPSQDQPMSSGVSQITTDQIINKGETIMGGSSEQERVHYRNPNHNASTVKVVRKIGSARNNMRTLNEPQPNTKG